MEKSLFTRIILVFTILIIIATTVLIFYIHSISIFQNKAEDNNSKTILESNYVKEYSLEKDTWPNAILVDSEDQVWIAGSKTYSLYKFNPLTSQIHIYKIKEPAGFMRDRPLMVWTMLEENNGIAIWLSQFGTRSMLLFDKNTEEFNEIGSLSHAAFQIKHDMDGIHGLPQLVQLALYKKLQISTCHIK